MTTIISIPQAALKSITNLQSSIKRQAPHLTATQVSTIAFKLVNLTGEIEPNAILNVTLPEEMDARS